MDLMTAQQVLAWAQLIMAGAASVQQVRGFLASLHPGVTDDELNAALQTIVDDATRRKALAEADLAAARALNPLDPNG